MESSQIVQDFILNVKRVTGLEEEERKIGAEWMERFEEAEEALATCCEILKSSLDERVKLCSVKVIQNKIKKTPTMLDLKCAKDLYVLFIDFLKTCPNLYITTQVCVLFGILFTRTHPWNISLSEMINDILEISCDCSDDLFSEKTATIFMRELFSDLTTFQGPESRVFRSKILFESESLDKIIADFIDFFAEDKFLKEIIEVCRLKAQFLPVKNILKCKNFLKICEMLRKTDQQENELVYRYIKCIKAFIKGIEVKSCVKTERQYRFFTYLTKNLRIFMDSGIQQDDQKLIVLIAGIVANLANIFFETYIDVVHGDDFSFCDELSYFGEFNNIYIYNQITKFWIQFENYFDLSNHHKFKHFSEKYVEIFVTQTLQALFISEQMINNMESLKDPFFINVRANMKRCLKTAFKLIPVQLHLNHVVSIMRTSQNDYQKIERCLFFFSTIMPGTRFSVDFDEVSELIPNIPSNAPSLLIERYCKYLKKFIDHRIFSGTRRICIDSIYKWLARVPGPATKILGYGDKEAVDKIDDILIDFEYINNIIVFCPHITEVESLAKFMACVITTFTIDDDVIVIIGSLVNFYSVILLQESIDDLNLYDFARRAIYFMTSLAIVLNNEKGMFLQDRDTPVIQNTFHLCFEVINRLKSNEEVCEKTCEVVDFILSATGTMCPSYPDYENLSKKLLQCYQISGFSCFIRTCHYLFKAIEEIDYDCGWFLRHCKGIFDKACDLLSKVDSNCHPRHIERIMKLLRKMLCRTYDDVLEAIDMGRLIVLASHGLLSHDEPTFNECLNVFVELFKGPYNTICEERPETNSIVVHLYNSHAHRIVRDCIEAILTRRKISYVRGCGKVLYIMKHVEFDGIRPLFKIDKWLVDDILETYSDEIRANENISSTIIKILNSSTEEKALDLAVTLNSKLFAA